MKSKGSWNRARTVWIVLTSIFVGFIFLQSSMTATVSHNESVGFLSVMNSLFSSLGIKYEFTNDVIRKMAHFAEFFILGILVVMIIYTYTKAPSKKLTTVFFIPLAVAVVDETIQLFVPGRAGLVWDIIIDFSGAVCGSLLMIFLLFLGRKIRGRR